ncbi:ATP-binding cassette domain-containing protein [Microbacterium sp. SYP-A9085]|uniref:ABC transporter ATP-binding protein n=1 Tax=Microbacterium sp. SYP-A9085 TaxID=2664454 RepID=UPI00129AB025|nr:ABC transporter ATP-binding protein [Microbacterium sp. SYP-A9085]MRH28116.1 ATP-binding cassette domain-containing protein [Microbacterium sp. SYP-A9085]
MPEGQVLEFAGLSKRFGSVLAVDDLTARVEPGMVTGFLGPNGAGKTTTLRMLLGLVRPTAGRVTIGGVPYAKLDRPMQTVGAVLEASSFHPGRSAADHLRVYARAAGLASSRVDDALGTVGLADVAGRKIGGYSLGMRQRLGLAAALLGDPGVLILDEPANGLDPEGITWMRGLLRELARQGRTVLVSSHLLAEVQQTVDSLLIIAQGRLVFHGGMDELSDPSEFATVADSPDRTGLAAALAAAGIGFEILRSGLTIRGTDPVLVGEAAVRAGVPLSLLQRRGPALEDIFFDLVNGLRVHASAEGAQEQAPEPEGAEAAEAEPTEEPTTEEPTAEEQTTGGGTSGAAFAVAATGVIDIVPVEEADSLQDEDERVFAMPAGDADEAAPEDEDEPQGADEDDAVAAPVEEDVVAGEPDHLPDDDDPHATKTDSDVAADEFFSSYDHENPAPPDEDAVPAASDTDTRDGGDVR